MAGALTRESLGRLVLGYIEGGTSIASAPDSRGTMRRHLNSYNHSRRPVYSFLIWGPDGTATTPPLEKRPIVIVDRATGQPVVTDFLPDVLQAPELPER